MRLGHEVLNRRVLPAAAHWIPARYAPLRYLPSPGPPNHDHAPSPSLEAGRSSRLLLFVAAPPSARARARARAVAVSASRLHPSLSTSLHLTSFPPSSSPLPKRTRSTATTLDDAAIQDEHLFVTQLRTSPLRPRTIASARPNLPTTLLLKQLFSTCLYLHFL